MIISTWDVSHEGSSGVTSLVKIAKYSGEIMVMNVYVPNCKQSIGIKIKINKQNIKIIQNLKSVLCWPLL